MKVPGDVGGVHVPPGALATPIVTSATPGTVVVIAGRSYEVVAVAEAVNDPATSNGLTVSTPENLRMTPRDVALAVVTATEPVSVPVAVLTIRRSDGRLPPELDDTPPASHPAGKSATVALPTPTHRTRVSFGWIFVGYGTFRVVAAELFSATAPAPW